jgi:hypothetical protein
VTTNDFDSDPATPMLTPVELAACKRFGLQPSAFLAEKARLALERMTGEPVPRTKATAPLQAPVESLASFHRVLEQIAAGASPSEAQRLRQAAALITKAVNVLREGGGAP